MVGKPILGLTEVCSRSLKLCLDRVGPVKVYMRAWQSWSTCRERTPRRTDGHRLTSDWFRRDLWLVQEGREAKFFSLLLGIWQWVGTLSILLGEHVDLLGIYAWCQSPFSPFLGNWNQNLLSPLRHAVDDCARGHLARKQLRQTQNDERHISNDSTDSGALRFSRVTLKICTCSVSEQFFLNFWPRK